MEAACILMADEDDDGGDEEAFIDVTSEGDTHVDEAHKGSTVSYDTMLGRERERDLDR